LFLLGDENGPVYVEIGGQGHVNDVDIWIVKDGLVRRQSFGRIGHISTSVQREETSAYLEERCQRRERGVDVSVGPRLLWWARDSLVGERERSERKREDEKKNNNNRYVNSE